jgi:hypothetical protein
VIYIALGFLLLGLLVGGAGMKRMGRLAGKAWRPGAGFLALLAFVAAALFAVRENVPVAVVLALIGLSLTLSVRRERHAARQNERTTPAVRDMGVEQAASILGVAPEASEAEVQAAYLRLIRRVHPDAGGAEGLAAQLNAARDVMARRGR